MPHQDSQLIDCETETARGKAISTSIPVRLQNRSSIPRRGIWNLAIGVAGVGYILLALCLNVQSPLFATLFVAAAAYEVIGSHSGHRRS